MFRKILLAALLAFTPTAFAQPVINSGQVKIQTNGGLAGDTNSALVTAIYRGTSAPSGPLSAGMLWLDTNTTPPILKEYTGSVWNIPLTPASVATQADTSSFPGGPTDGQIFFSAAPPSLWVYSSTLSSWVTFAMPLVTSAANIRDVYTASVIATVGAPTVAASGTAGSLSAGAYLYRITCRNSTGGETDGGTISASVSPGGSKSTDLSSIPTCGTGGTNRNIYRTKTNTSTPFYWVQNIADNTTTTANDGLADASALLLAPDINFSAALPGAWTTINNTATPLTGGCGGTGATRGSMVCYAGQAGLSTGVVTTDSTHLRGSVSIATYSTGNYTLQYRVKQLSADGDTYLSILNPSFGGLRNGITDAQQRIYFLTGGTLGTGPGNWTGPPGSSNHPQLCYNERATASASASSATAAGNPFPQLDAFPLWVRIVKSSTYIQVYTSSNAVSWSPFILGTGASNSNTSTSIDYTNMGTSSMDHFELPIGASMNNGAQANKGWIEIDSFTLTVN